MTHNEYEKKYMLSERQYNFLKDGFFKKCEPTVQTNYYYDNEKMTNYHAGITMRIRETGNVFKAEFKVKDRFNFDFCTETSKEVKSAADTSFFGDNVILFGTLATERRTLNFKNNVSLSLDKNTYKGFTDYELEAEYHPLAESDCEEVIGEIFDAFAREGIELPAQSGKRKSERFYEKGYSHG